jgi:hypothetical protein
LTTWTFDGRPIFPFCVTVTTLPAIVSAAVRAVFEVFTATVIVALPLPDPPGPSVIHDGAPDVDQAHPACVVTLTALVLAPAVTVTLSGDTE